MSRVHHSSECAFEVDPAWVDRTVYVYISGEVRVLIERFGAPADARKRVDDALAAFARTVPLHAVVERREISSPGAGEIVAHRMPGEISQFEKLVYWGVGDECWMFRTTGPLDSESACSAVVDTFLATYEPTETP
ncbi:MAG TPA: hypothetical protein VL400_24070 [Polyangiaceae bacterium]|jgi:hypothetical protein|nr:hypothetical protein [Polyangiaceae bacterium]